LRNQKKKSGEPDNSPKTDKAKKKAKKGKGFAAGSAYKSKRISGKKKRTCNHCQEKFSKIKDYYEHKRIYHSDIEDVKKSETPINEEGILKVKTEIISENEIEAPVETERSKIKSTYKERGSARDGKRRSKVKLERKDNIIADITVKHESPQKKADSQVAASTRTRVKSVCVVTKPTEGECINDLFTTKEKNIDLTSAANTSEKTINDSFMDELNSIEEVINGEESTAKEKQSEEIDQSNDFENETFDEFNDIDYENEDIMLDEENDSFEGTYTVMTPENDVSDTPLKDLKMELFRIDEELDIDEYGTFQMPSVRSNSDDEKILNPDEEKLLNLPWYESRYHTCLMCSKELPLGSMYGHINELHKQSMVWYKKEYPEDDFSVPHWTCSICKGEVRWTAHNIGAHIRANHNMTKQEYENSVMNFDESKKHLQVDGPHADMPWYESTKHDCKICARTFNFSQMYDHLRTHSCTLADYKTIFPDANMTIPKWECQVCQTCHSWARRPIQQHLQNKHNMSMFAYENKYVKQVADDEGSTGMPMALPLECILEPETELSHTNHNALIAKPIKSQEQRPESLKQGGKTIWLPWYESKLHTCLICGETRVLGLSFKNHIYDSHMHISRKEYKRRFPYADIEPLVWNCLVCKRGIMWTKKSIADHLKVLHKTSIKEFEAAYELSSKRPVSSQMMPEGVQIKGNSSPDKLIEPRSKLFNLLTAENTQPREITPLSPLKPVVAIKQEIVNEIVNIKKEASQNGGTEEYKSDWYEAIKVQCQLCKQNVIGFTSHIEEHHKMQKVEYIKIWPDDAAKFEVCNWICKVCGMDTVLEDDSIAKHLELHGISLQDYGRTFEETEEENSNGVISEELYDESVDYMDESIDFQDGAASPTPGYDDTVQEVSEENIVIENEMDEKLEEPLPWYESTRTTCSVCHETFLHGKFIKHINIKHGLHFKDYRAKFPNANITVSNYQCLVCGVSIAHYLSPISGHLSSKHNITHLDYYDQYVKNNTGVTQPTFPAKPARIAPRPIRPAPVPVASPLKKNWNPYVGKQAESKKTFTHKLFQETGKLPWYESGSHTCRLCGELWLLGSLKTHLFDRHEKISRSTYKDQFPDVELEPGIWFCQICNSGIKHLKDNINNHIKVHSLTMKEYGKLYSNIDHSKPTDSPQQLRHDPKPVRLEKDPLSVSASYTPDDVSKRKFRCKICAQLVSFNSVDIKTHLRNFHDMTLGEYQPLTHMLARTQKQQFPQMTQFTPPPEEQTPLFHSLFHDTNEASSPVTNMAAIDRSAARAMRSPTFATGLPNLSASGIIPGTPWYNKCKWTCQLCNKSFSAGFWKHVNESHSLKKDEYIKTYGKDGIQIVQYWCQICNKRIPWSGASINGHVKVDHDITLKEYEALYSQEAQEVAVPPPPSFGGSGETRKETRNGDQWFNGCEYNCQLCSRLLTSIGGLRRHVRDVHQIDKEDYFNKFGRQGILMRKYKCKICSRNFPWSGVSISKHTKQAHDMTLKEYSIQYEDPNVSGLQSEPKSHSIRQQLSLLPRDMPCNLPKNKWYNKCSWTCQICSRVFKTNGSAFQKHVSAEHNVSKEDYYEQYGNTGVVYVDHQCRLCQKTIPCNGLTMCKHFKYAHGLTLQQYEENFEITEDSEETGEEYEPTDEFWYNKCEWKCVICGKKNKSLGCSKKHISSVHDMGYESYLAEYGTQGIFEVDFQCGICQATMSCNGVSISNHLSNNHHLSLQQYEAKYVSHKNKQAALGKDGEKNGNLNSFEVQEKFQKSNRRWYQKCFWTCQFCNTTYGSTTAIYNHVKDKHSMDKDTYLDKFGDLGKVVERYTCKICQRDMKCDAKTIHTHLKYVHKTAIKDYSKEYHSEETEETEQPYYHDETYHIEYGREEDEEEDTSLNHIVIENDSLEIEDPFDPLDGKNVEGNGEELDNSQESNPEEFDLNTSFHLSESDFTLEDETVENSEISSEQKEKSKENSTSELQKQKLKSTNIKIEEVHPEFYEESSDSFFEMNDQNESIDDIDFSHDTMGAIAFNENMEVGDESNQEFSI